MKTIATLLCSVAVLASAARAADSFDTYALGPVIAKGKGVEVRRGQLDDAFVAYRANLAARGSSIPEMRRESTEAQLLDRMIVTQLLLKKATPEDQARAKTNAMKFIEESSKNTESPEGFVRHLKSLGMTLTQFTNRVMEQAVSEEVVTRELKSKITISDDAIKKFYDTNGQAFAQPEMARASHILVSTRDLTAGLPLSAEQKQARKAKAEKILERVRKGEDFGKVAQEVSDDPAAKQNKGEYKFTRAKDDPRRAMVPEFEKVTFNLQPGEISDIVTTDYGYHIIKLHEIIPASKAPLADATPRIREHLLQVELERQMTPYFDKLKKEGAVEITDERLKAAVDRIHAEDSKPAS